MRVDIRLAERLKKINPSSTLAVTSKAKKLKAEGADIISLAAGEPDFDTPDFIKKAAIDAINSGFTKYTPTSGILELKQAISLKLKKDNSLDYPPEQIIVSCGAKHSIFNALMVLVSRNDEVIIPSPYWVSYPEMVNLCEGIPRILKTRAQDNFKITTEELEKYTTAKTKILILNSPSNPCGSLYSEAELRAIAEICAKKKIFVISDEIYEKLIYDKAAFTSIASLGKDIFDFTITVNGVSKAYSMTGWRIGYLAGPRDVIEAISRLQDHSTSCPSSISQKAALAALKESDNFVLEMVAEFQRRRDFVIQKLSDMKMISYVLPQGAFYIFCDISKTGLDSLTFANRLLEEAGVAVIPGEGFGRDDFVRISFATGLSQLEKAMERLSGWLSKL